MVSICSAAAHKLGGNVAVGGCAFGIFVKIDGRHTEAGCFRKAHVARHGRFEELAGKVLLDFFKHLHRKIEPAVVHGDDHADKLKQRIV